MRRVLLVGRDAEVEHAEHDALGDDVTVRGVRRYADVVAGVDVELLIADVEPRRAAGDVVALPHRLVEVVRVTRVGRADGARGGHLHHVGDGHLASA